MVTSDTLTGAETPKSGRISTLPSIRGYSIVSIVPAYPVGLHGAQIPQKRTWEDGGRTDVADMPG